VRTSRSRAHGGAGGTGRRLGGSGKKDKRAHYRADADWVKPRDGGPANSFVRPLSRPRAAAGGGGGGDAGSVPGGLRDSAYETESDWDAGVFIPRDPHGPSRSAFVTEGAGVAPHRSRLARPAQSPDDDDDDDDDHALPPPRAAVAAPLTPEEKMREAAKDGRFSISAEKLGTSERSDRSDRSDRSERGSGKGGKEGRDEHKAAGGSGRTMLTRREEK